MLVGEVGRAEQRVALAVHAVAGGAVGLEDRLAGGRERRVGLAGRSSCSARRRHLVARPSRADHRAPGRHRRRCGPPVMVCHDRVGIAAPLPVAVGQVREALGAAAVRAVALGAVVLEQVACRGHRLRVVGELRERSSRRTARRQAAAFASAAAFSCFVLPGLRPALDALQVAETRVQDEVQRPKNATVM